MGGLGKFFGVFFQLETIVHKTVGPLQIFFGFRPEYISCSCNVMYHPTKFWSCTIFCTILTLFTFEKLEWLRLKC